MGVFGGHAGDGLGRLIFLFHSQAHDVVEANPAPLAFIDIIAVEVGEADFGKAHVTGFLADHLGELFGVQLRVRRRSGLDVAGVPRGRHEWSIVMFVFFAMDVRFRCQHRHCPLAIGTIIDVLAFDGIFPAVEVHLVLADGSARDRHEVFGDRDGHRGVAG